MYKKPHKTTNNNRQLETIKSIHINNFDWLRLLAAITVIYGHAFPLTNTPSLLVLDNSIQATAVKVFFVISGYLICMSWLSDPCPHRYITKRILRIIPGLTVVVVFAAVIIGPIFTTISISRYFSNESFFSYFKNIILFPIYNLPGVFYYLPYKIAVNGSLWSLPVEFFMYLILPVLLTISKLKRLNLILPILTLLSCILSLICLRSSIYHIPRIIVYGSSLRSALDVSPYFLIGATYAFLNLKKYLNLEVSLIAVCTLALLQPTTIWLSELALYCILPYALLSFAVAGDQLFSMVGKYGDFSYGLYLYGFLTEQIFNQLFHGILTPFQDAIYSLPVAFLFAVLSWFIIEKPALQLKRFL